MHKAAQQVWPPPSSVPSSRCPLLSVSPPLCVPSSLCLLLSVSPPLGPLLSVSPPLSPLLSVPSSRSHPLGPRSTREQRYVFSQRTEENEHKADSQEHTELLLLLSLSCVSWEKNEWVESHRSSSTKLSHFTCSHRLLKGGGRDKGGLGNEPDSALLA